MIGWLRLVLARAAADRMVMLVAWLVILATVTLFAASAIYAEAVGRSGLAARLARSTVSEGNLQVRLLSAPDEAAAADAIVTREIERALGSAGVSIHRSGRAESLPLPTSPDAHQLAVLAFAEDLPAHTRLVGGSWPVSAQQPLQAALSAAAASELQLEVGSSLPLVSRRDDRQVDVQVVAIFEPLEPGAPFWWEDPLELGGVSGTGSFTSYGPFFVTREDALAGASAGSVALIWRAEPDVAGIDGASIRHIEASLRGLPGRLDDQFPRTAVDVDTGLPQLLATAGSSLLVSRAGILLLDLQLGLLGLYALVMVSALIIERRRADTALLRSRGASFAQLTRLGLAESVLLIVPALVIAPLLALALVAGFDAVGPLADIGVLIVPRLTPDAILLALAAGAVALLGLTLPALAGSGPIASVRRQIGRQLQRTAAQRVGLDVALLVLAGIALWQLNQYGTPLTRSLRGSLGVDPLLVAAPMAGLLAGALVSLRLFPLLAALAERAFVRRPGPALAIRQLARRPLHYTRAAMLLIVAAAVTVFAGAYGATAVASQHDQVAYAVGGDVRLTSAPTLDPPELAAAFGEIEGVDAVAPIVRAGYQLGQRSARGSLLALGTAGATDVVAFRADLGTAPLGELVEELRPAGGTAGIALAESARRLAVELDVELAPVTASNPEAAIPVDWQGVSASAVLVDGHGLMYRLAGDAALGQAGGTISFALPEHAALGGGPLMLALAAIEPSVRAPGGTPLTGSLRIAGLATSAGTAGDDWQALPIDLAGWQSARYAEAGAPAVLEPAETLPGGVAILAELPLRGAGRATYSLRPPGVRDSDEQPIPALVNGAFLEAAGAELGDRSVVAEPFSTARTLLPAALVSGFPTVAAEPPFAVVDLAALALADYADLGRLPEPSEFWLAAEAADPVVLRRQLADSPLASGDVVIASEALAGRLTDPLSVGTTGALLIGTVAALLFAVVGFMTNAAVSVRERMIEFGLLRSIGVSRRQLANALALESTFLLGASLVVGVLLGTALAIFALPTATVTEQGTAPLPPAIPVWPVEPVIVLVVLAVGLLVAALVLFRRRLAADELASLLRLREE